MATINEIAQAVVTELNSASFSLPFTAERRYLPRFELSDLQTLRVTVVPQGVTTEAAARAHNQYDYAIDVAVQQKLSDDENDPIDDLLTLVEELADFFRLRRLADYPAAHWIKTDHKAIYAPEHLDQLRQLTSLLTLTYRVVR